MAEDASVTEGLNEELNLDVSEKKKSSRFMLLLVAGLVFVALVAGAVFYFIGAGEGQETAEQPKEEELVKGPPIYFSIEKPFIVNFKIAGESRARFMQVDITLVTRKQSIVDAVELHTPLIRNNLLMLLSSQEYIDLSTAEGKEEVRLSALESVQKILKAEVGEVGIENLLFTKFVMQ